MCGMRSDPSRGHCALALGSSKTSTEVEKSAIWTQRLKLSVWEQVGRWAWNGMVKQFHFFPVGEEWRCWVLKFFDSLHGFLPFLMMFLRYCQPDDTKAGCFQSRHNVLTLIPWCTFRYLKWKHTPTHKYPVICWNWKTLILQFLLKWAAITQHREKKMSHKQLWAELHWAYSKEVLFLCE